MIDTGVVHMKAETTVNAPQASTKMVLSSTQREAALRKRAASEIAPRKSASGGYNDSVGGWKWEMSDGKCRVKAVVSVTG